MTGKPPVQKPPVRTPNPPPMPGGFGPPGPPAYVTSAPVYVPPPPPPPDGAPSTAFFSVVGWVSVIWLVAILILGFFLRYLSYSGYGASLASVSMWLGLVVLLPIGLFSGLFATFELGRETTGDAPKPTMFRLTSALVLLLAGVIGQVGFSFYLTSSDAKALTDRMAGLWERVGNVPTNDGPWGGGFHGEMKSTIARGSDFGEKGALDASPFFSTEPPTETLEFTAGGTVVHERLDPNGSGKMVSDQKHYDATGAKTFTIKQLGYQTSDMEVEFISEDEISLSTTSWYTNNDLRGRWRRIGGGFGSESGQPLTGEFAEMLPKLRDQLRGFQVRKRKLADLHRKLEGERATLVSRLQGLGVRSAEDLKKATKSAKDLSEELVRLVRDMKAVQAKHDDCDSSIVKIEIALRQVDRQIALQQADVSDLTEVSELLTQLNVRLEKGTSAERAVEAINDQVLLEEQFGN